MSELPLNFRRAASQAIHVVAMPLSFFAFMLIYRPFNVTDTLQLGKLSFGVNLTLIACIIFGSMCIMRTIFYLVRRRIDSLTYFFWCIFEMVVTTFFVALYAWLMEHTVEPYFLVVSRACSWIFTVLIFPYVIVTLALFLAAERRYRNQPSEEQRMRFYDERRNLKLVVAAQSVLYIEAEENYVNVHYLDEDRTRNYLIRRSMKSIEELCATHGLLRCHRSFYVNPTHVKVLRKDREGAIVAELDTPQTLEIPVTKRYYDALSATL
ncbi:MAG: LytTR family transcriptional regulator [Rikenellaceae bacterium]|nr:LytTR family transcriptional regulator [Rikenellaceae bacterium]MBQ9147932.1 LytTR family transcriptional regulator [Rikenellaceae bacterium]MBR2049264.1 LytTR family transcriptional regulator [Rikenellaceae bacterium]MBR2420223.1 LytTR family transcriptional regulator [Rikenellaceae bacterium]MBR2932130.1 LytTR family transcriptional regulator [Rikenellaceae bacterium]